MRVEKRPLTKHFMKPIHIPALACFALVACSSEAVEVAIEITVGQEAGTLTADPPVTRVEIVATSAGGATTAKASAAPGGSFDLGELPDDQLFTFEATGYDATGAAVVRGRSLGVVLAAVQSGPLPVFVQRTETWARPPGGLVNAHADAPTATFGERFLFTTGGTGSAEPRGSDFYDLVGLGGATSGTLPLLARSLVMLSSSALLVADDGASWVNFDTGEYFNMALPAGLASFADVAGGATVIGSDGTSYVVGPSRSAVATASVLRVKTDGTVSALTAGEARAGAAAAWIDGTGLVLAGGSATGAGVEILAVGGTGFAPRPYPADPTIGASLVSLGSGAAALVGGALGADAAPTRTIDLGCIADCAADPIGASLLPPLTSTSAFSIATGSLRTIVVGHDTAAPFLTRTFLVDLGTGDFDEMALREPRSGASPVAAPNGTLAIVGGAHPDGTPALSVETWFPQ